MSFIDMAPRESFYASIPDQRVDYMDRKPALVAMAAISASKGELTTALQISPDNTYAHHQDPEAYAITPHENGVRLVIGYKREGRLNPGVEPPALAIKGLHEMLAPLGPAFELSVVSQPDAPWREFMFDDPEQSAKLCQITMKDPKNHSKEFTYYVQPDHVVAAGLNAILRLRQYLEPDHWHLTA